MSLPRILSEQDLIACLYVERDPVALFVDLARADGDHFALLRFLFGRVGDDDSTLHGLLFFQPPHEHAVV